MEGCADEWTVTIHWIPLGAGAHFVRLNGIVYEAVKAAVERRPRRGLYHSVVEVQLGSAHYFVEMTPEPDEHGQDRGVVTTGPVGLRRAGRWRMFRYEVRRWLDGIVPDLADAVGHPTGVTADPAVARTVFDLLPVVPTYTWGRDEARTGDMWSCNSITGWVLTRAGCDVDAIAPPRQGRAPGWDAGVAVARRELADGAGSP